MARKLKKHGRQFSSVLFFRFMAAGPNGSLRVCRTGTGVQNASISARVGMAGIAP